METIQQVRGATAVNKNSIQQHAQQQDQQAKVRTSFPKILFIFKLAHYPRELTMKEIGDKMGIDESRVSQLHSAALNRLRSKVESMIRVPEPKTPPAFMVAALESSQQQCSA